ARLPWVNPRDGPHAPERGDVPRSPDRRRRRRARAATRGPPQDDEGRLVRGDRGRGGGHRLAVSTTRGNATEGFIRGHGDAIPIAPPACQDRVRHVVPVRSDAAAKGLAVV